MMFSSIGSRHPLLLRFHPSLRLHEKRRTPFSPLNLSQKWPRTRKMTLSRLWPCYQGGTATIKSQRPLQMPQSHCIVAPRCRENHADLFLELIRCLVAEILISHFSTSTQTFKEEIQQPRVKHINNISLETKKNDKKRGTESTHKHRLCSVPVVCVTNLTVWWGNKSREKLPRTLHKMRQRGPATDVISCGSMSEPATVLAPLVPWNPIR